MLVLTGITQAHRARPLRVQVPLPVLVGLCAALVAAFAAALWRGPALAGEDVVARATPLAATGCGAP